MQHRNAKTKYFAKVVGSIIQNKRIKKNLSINRLANGYGLDVGNTSRIEKGSIEVKLVTLWKIAEALDISVSELIKIIEKKLGKDFHFYED